MWGKQLAAMLAIYTGKGVTPEVNLGVHKSCMPQPSAFKAAHSGFETQKSETWVSVASQMSTKILKRKQKDGAIIYIQYQDNYDIRFHKT